MGGEERDTLGLAKREDQTLLPSEATHACGDERVLLLV